MAGWFEKACSKRPDIKSKANSHNYDVHIFLHDGSVEKYAFRCANIIDCMRVVDYFVLTGNTKFDLKDVGEVQIQEDLSRYKS